MKKSVLFLALSLLGSCIAGCGKEEKIEEKEPEKIDFRQYNEYKTSDMIVESKGVPVKEISTDIFKTNKVIFDECFDEYGVCGLLDMSGNVGIYNAIDDVMIVPQTIPGKLIEDGELVFDAITCTNSTTGNYCLLKLDYNQKSYIIDIYGNEIYSGEFIPNHAVKFTKFITKESQPVHEETNEYFLFTYGENKKYCYVKDGKIHDLQKLNDVYFDNLYFGEDLSEFGLPGYSYILGDYGRVTVFKDNEYFIDYTLPIDDSGESFTMLFSNYLVSYAIAPGDFYNYDIVYGDDYITTLCYLTDLLTGESREVNLDYMFLDAAPIFGPSGVRDHLYAECFKIQEDKRPILQPTTVIFDENLEVADKPLGISYFRAEKVNDDYLIFGSNILDKNGDNLFKLPGSVLGIYPKQELYVVNYRLGTGLINFAGDVALDLYYKEIRIDSETGNILAYGSQKTPNILEVYDKDLKLKKTINLLNYEVRFTDRHTPIIVLEGKIDGALYICDSEGNLTKIYEDISNRFFIPTYEQGTHGIVIDQKDVPGVNKIKHFAFGEYKKLAKVWTGTIEGLDTHVRKGESILDPIIIEDLSNIKFENEADTSLCTLLKPKNTGLYSIENFTAISDCVVYKNNDVEPHYPLDSGTHYFFEEGKEYIIAFDLATKNFEGSIDYVGPIAEITADLEIAADPEAEATSKAYYRAFKPKTTGFYELNSSEVKYYDGFSCTFVLPTNSLFYLTKGETYFIRYNQLNMQEEYVLEVPKLADSSRLYELTYDSLAFSANEDNTIFTSRNGKYISSIDISAKFDMIISLDYDFYVEEGTYQTFSIYVDGSPHFHLSTSEKGTFIVFLSKFSNLSIEFSREKDALNTSYLTISNINCIDRNSNN